MVLWITANGYTSYTNYEILTDKSIIPDLYKNAEKLWAFSNILTQIPPNICKLINLYHLDLHDNLLTELPSEIGTLINLINLDLSYNRLKIISYEINQLINLDYLFLDNNKLKFLLLLKRYIRINISKNQIIFCFYEVINDYELIYGRDI